MKKFIIYFDYHILQEEDSFLIFHVIIQYDCSEETKDLILQ